jgi:hypothetical protein
MAGSMSSLRALMPLIPVTHPTPTLHYHSLLIHCHKLAYSPQYLVLRCHKKKDALNIHSDKEYLQNNVRKDFAQIYVKFCTEIRSPITFAKAESSSTKATKLICHRNRTLFMLEIDVLDSVLQDSK